MRFHDFHLRGYTVGNFGAELVLDLVLDTAHLKEESKISFTSVACYRFVHSGGAIITEIREAHLSEFVMREEAALATIASQQGLSFWTGDARAVGDALTKEGYRVWLIESAIGFSGFVIAKDAA